MYATNVKTISRYANFIRKIKIDKWPLLINIFLGQIIVGITSTLCFMILK